MKKNTEKNKQLNIRLLMKIVRASHLPWFWIAVTFTVNMVYNRLLLTLPVSTGRLLAGDLSNEALYETLAYYGLYALVVVVQAALVAYTDAVSIRNSRYGLFGKMLKIREDYYDRVESSDMISALTVDLYFALPRFINMIVAVIPDIYYLVRASVTVTSYDVSLLLTMLAFLPLKYLYLLVIGRKLFSAQSDVMQRIGLLTGTLGERIGNVQLVKAFNREAEELEAGKQDNRALYKANVRLAAIGGISNALDSTIDVLQQFACMVVAVLLMRQGRITMAEWVTFFLFFTNISSKITALVSDWMSAKVVTGSLERTGALYEAPEEDPNREGIRAEDADDLSICFDNVRFSYAASAEETDKPALDDVSFSIPEGSKTAIVGFCGSGKSTALSLIERFYTPASGRVLLSGREVSSYQLENYRDLIAYVPQNNQVFSSTLREALLYGNREAIQDEVLLSTAEKTGFKSYIDLQENGLDTYVMSPADSMSGGQLQKLIITREILKKSRIVLFDEPTSALDKTATREVKDMLMHSFADKTVVVVTHDLDLIDEMDRIVLLADGHVVATGTYDELLLDCPEFRDLAMSRKTEEVCA